MDELYYIEEKSYWLDANGTDHQVSDAGELPTIYRSRTEALKRCYSKVKLYTEEMGYKVVIPNNKYPGVCRRYHYACRLQKENPQIRLEIRLYTIYVN